MTDKDLLQEALTAFESGSPNDRADVMKAIRARLSQPEPEELGEVVPADEEQLKRIAKLIEPEPVAWMEVVKRIDPNSREISEQTILRNYDTGHGEPLYTFPPQREWQGLTDEEIELFSWEHAVVDEEAVRAIEAKLKEKNT